MLHVVIDGVPRRTKAALLAVGIVIDDINTGNACLFVDGNVVVGDATTILIGEGAAVACCVGSLPDTFNDVTRIVH